MGATNTEHYTSKQNSIAVLLKALGHPARIAIIEYLVKAGKCICGDIVNEIPLSQPTISQHLKELKSAGIIKGTIEGNTVCYCLDPKTVGELKKYMDGILQKMEKNSNCC